MSRRSAHTADELRGMFIAAGREIIERNGLNGIKARDVATAIGYSPGTLYNVFKSLDDLVLHIEASLLDELLAHLQAMAARDMSAVARAYLEFAHRHPKLWNALLEHTLPPAVGIPDWYRRKLEALRDHLMIAMRQEAPRLSDDECRRSAEALWAAVHGLVSLSTSDKFACVPSDRAAAMTAHVVACFIDGINGQGRA